MTANTAAWIDSPYADLAVRESPYPVAGDTQLVVRTRALAVNPLDAITQSNGRLMYGWLSYPAILGEDVAGDVVAVGRSVTRFQAGDRVLGYAVGMEKGRDHTAEGGFQEFVVIEERLAAALPDAMPFEEAVVLPLAVSTAAAALFQSDQLGLAHPSPGAAQRDETVVVWGGSTSVGSNAIQLARAAGYRVITTASPSNHELMRKLGASDVVDYRDPAAVAKVATAARGSRVVGVVAIAVGSAEPCVAIAAATGARRVALTSPSVSFYDQPRRSGFSVSRISLMARLVGGNIALQVKCVSRGIRARFVWGSTIMHNDVGEMLWTAYLPAALADGSHRAEPQPEIVGNGLVQIQGAIDRMRVGVSARKLVVTLP
ncbi:NADPH:quinone reductase-like Zn-dependent oxidoreductase [Conyzicola lurida]|uniref:NADPH:quinone reductase-like Zn-dependent oxidoreductase n=1 Tax=Conyzicola lurida TaxID=1172621 RepID=A0A841AE72_9MICO|nr:zinc-binding alcohol dehydrogenase family protein [Conyzicola lurida]MBB5842030.1 NADPH:quinone reductase-like Zn-dependent oxidoreductase [Conyzicola lurida]